MNHKNTYFFSLAEKYSIKFIVLLNMMWTPMTKNTISEALSRFASLPLLFWSDFLDWIRFGKILTEQFLAKTLRPQSVR